MANAGPFMRVLEKHVNIAKGSFEAVALLTTNQKVPATKKVRMIYGFGLLEARYLVDILGDVFRGNKPQNY